MDLLLFERWDGAAAQIGPNGWAKVGRGALEASMDHYMQLKHGAMARLNRRLLVGHPERSSWVGKHLRFRRGWTVGHHKRPVRL